MDLLKPFLQRVAQPVILSFCISWILWNWEIVVALLWYDAKTISATKSATHMEYIKLHANGWKNYGLPLFFALLYLPTRYGVNWLNAFFRTKERDHVLQVRGTGKMSTLRFLELKKSYDDRITQISDYLDNHAKLTTDLNNAETNVIELQEEMLKLSNGAIKSKNILENLQKDYDTAYKQLENYKNLSNVGSILGNYEFNIWHKDRKSPMSTIHNIAFSGDLQVKFDSNDCVFIFKSKYPDIQLILDYYFYNILSESLLIKFEDKGRNNKHANSLLELIKKITNKTIILHEHFNNSRIVIDDEYYLELEKTN